LLGNYLRGERRAFVLQALTAAGIEAVQVGRHGVARPDPELAIADVDLVIGYGRSVVEGMAGGRAAYVLDYAGGDGWVTPDSWAMHEAGAFAGRSTDRIVDFQLLSEDLDRYDATMGIANRDLAVVHHGARQHAKSLVEILREVGASDAYPAPIDEMERLVRLAWRSDSRGRELEREIAEINDRQHAKLAEMWQRINEAEERSREAEERSREAEERSREAEEREASARHELEDLRAQRRVRLANALSRPLDRLRAHRR